MAETIQLAVHLSAFPEALAASRRRCFEQRRIDPKFHYLSARQSQAWLALHRKYSPFAAEPKGTDVYDAAFEWTAKNLPFGGTVQLVSLACGGAGKEERLAKSLRRAGREISVTVSDISVPLVIEGHQTLAKEIAPANLKAMVLDLLEAGDLSEIFPADSARGASRIVTCFGLMPNVEPAAIAAQLATLLDKNGVLLVGANLAPESNYRQGTERALADYDNAATRAWLSLLLADCGFAPDDGEIRFGIEPCASLPELLQIVAHYHLHRERTVDLDGGELKFSAGEKLRLFFSNRFTPSRLRRVFEARQMKILGEWISAEENEGVMACRLTCP